MATLLALSREERAELRAMARRGDLSRPQFGLPLHGETVDIDTVVFALVNEVDRLQDVIAQLRGMMHAGEYPSAIEFALAFEKQF